MRCSKAVGLGVVGVILGVGWASAKAAEDVQSQIPAKQQVRLLEKYGAQGIDANEDGVLTREEVRAFLKEKRTEKLGASDQANLGMGRAHRGGRRGTGFGPGGPGGPAGNIEMLQRFLSPTPPEYFNLSRHPDADTDGDGTLSNTEWQAFAKARLDEIKPRLLARNPEVDTDKDGTISNEELTAFVTAQVQKQRAHLLVDHPELDTDGDGVLSDAEFNAFQATQQQGHLAMILQRHPEADTNGDGVLSEEEAQAWRESMPPGRPGPRGSRMFNRGR